MNTWQLYLLIWQGGGPRMGYLCFFCLHRITCRNIPIVTQVKYYLLLEIVLLYVCLYGPKLEGDLIWKEGAQTPLHAMSLVEIFIESVISLSLGLHQINQSR